MVEPHNVTSSAYYLSIEWPMEEIVIGCIILAIWAYIIIQFIMRSSDWQILMIDTRYRPEPLTKIDFRK